jgi:hypothetical protein
VVANTALVADQAIKAAKAAAAGDGAAISAISEVSTWSSRILSSLNPRWEAWKKSLLMARILKRESMVGAVRDGWEAAAAVVVRDAVMLVLAVMLVATRAQLPPTVRPRALKAHTAKRPWVRAQARDLETAPALKQGLALEGLAML